MKQKFTIKGNYSGCSVNQKQQFIPPSPLTPHNSPILICHLFLFFSQKQKSLKGCEEASANLCVPPFFYLMRERIGGGPKPRATTKQSHGKFSHRCRRRLKPRRSRSVKALNKAPPCACAHARGRAVKKVSGPSITK